jgi:hypothetical protein
MDRFIVKIRTQEGDEYELFVTAESATQASRFANLQQGEIIVYVIPQEIAG